MSLSIEIRRIDYIIVLDLAGRLSVMDQGLRRLAEELMELGERFFIISLANVSYLDNAGLGQLCLIYTMAKNRGGDMKLLRPTPRIRKMLSITKLDTVFQSFESVTEATRSMPLFITTVSA